jgi:hypothetical protein
MVQGIDKSFVFHDDRAGSAFLIDSIDAKKRAREITGPSEFGVKNVLLPFLWRRFGRFLYFRHGPVVQIVGDLVAIAAFRELRHDTGRMGRTMAVLALGNHFMLCLMAERACQGAVLDLAGAENVQNLAVASAAVF